MSDPIAACRPQFYHISIPKIDFDYIFVSFPINIPNFIIGIC